MQGDEGGVRGVLCVSHPAMGSSGERGSGLVLFHSLASWQEAGGGGGSGRSDPKGFGPLQGTTWVWEAKENGEFFWGPQQEACGALGRLNVTLGCV